MNLISEKEEKQRLYYNLAQKQVIEYHKKGVFAKLDMHIHTDMSDGLFSIPHIITMAKEFVLECIVITDHNTCLPGYELVNSLSKEMIGDLEVYVGCEIATKIEDPVTGKFIPIEILSYFANPYEIQAFLDKYEFAKKTSQKEQLKILLNTCDKLGLVHSDNIEIPDGFYATEILCKDLITHKENQNYFLKTAPKVWNDPKLFYKMCVSNPSSDFYIDTTSGLPYYLDTIKAIKDAGGYAIIAHPFLYSRNSESEVKELLDYILYTAPDVSGFEAIHSAHNEKQRKFIINYAKEHNMLYTGGTDFHSGPQTVLGYGKNICPIVLTKNKINFFWRYKK